MGISFGSINTGLPKDIVKQIIEAEKIPIKTLEKRKEKIESKKTQVDELINLVRNVQQDTVKNSTEISLKELSVDANKEIIDINVDKNMAVPSSYQFEVVQLAQKSSTLSTGISDPDKSYVGVGYIHYTLPSGENREIYIDPENSTLNKIASLINSNNEMQVRANVVNDGSGSKNPWRLLLSLKETGDDNKAEFPHLYFVDGRRDFTLEYERGAQDAIVKIDGFKIETPENEINNLIPGAAINLKQAKPGEEFSINIREDIPSISEKIKKMVENINGVLNFINKQNKLNKDSDTSRTLGGDITIQNIEGQLRNLIFKERKTGLGNIRAHDLGISFQKSGLLTFDQDKFESIMAKESKKVYRSLVGFYDENKENSVPGLITELNKISSYSLKVPNGTLFNRKKTFQTNIDRINKDISRKEILLKEKEESLKNKFSRLESTIAKIRNQGAGLSGLVSSQDIANTVPDLQSQ